MARPCGLPANSWYQPPRGSSRQPSYSSSVAAWTSCDQPRQHAIRHRSHPCTGTSQIRPTYSYSRTPYAAPWTTIQRPAPTKHLKLSCAAGRSLYQQTESSLRTCWMGPRTTPQLSPAAHQLKLHSYLKTVVV